MKRGAIMLIERVEQRVLGALRLVDRVTQTSLKRPLFLYSNRARLVRNARGYYVVTHATGLESHSASFQRPPVAPALESRNYSIEITDPLGHYLPRLLELRLPRDPDPAHAEDIGSLFRPVDVALYPAGTAPLSPNWSTLRISVARVSNHAPVRGALLQVINAADDTLLASGISDVRGEALVIVPGVPITKFADEENEEGEGGGEPPVVVNTLPVRLELSLGTTTPWPVNPDLLEQHHVANRRMSMDLALSTGRMERVVINLT
jgi:hypothetical protein